MKLKDAPIDAHVEIYATADGMPIASHKSGGSIIRAWVVYRNSFDTLVGWKLGEKSPSHSWLNTSYGPSGVYPQAYWIFSNADIAGIVQNNGRVIVAQQATPIGGMACRRCGEFFPYATANRPDGVHLICYSCRMGWLPEGW